MMMRFNVGLMVVMSTACAQSQDLGAAMEVARSLNVFNGLETTLTFEELIRNGKRNRRMLHGDKSDKSEEEKSN